jgi:hypothetical protein
MWTGIKDWFVELDPAVQAAIVSAIVLLITALITTLNVVVKNWLDRRAARAQQSESARDTYRRYAEPLSAAAQSLYYRLRELFEFSGAHYLTASPMTEYEQYKALSTQFRLAALLGWIAALERELLLVDQQSDRSVACMRKAVQEVQSALAEGGHVEFDRVDLLNEIWRVLESDAEAESLCQPLDSHIDRFLHARNLRSPIDLDRK